ncbi:MAG: hypothetical protein B6D41_11730 [Chloroflexi bacterium UTCFX4]|jgi:hypothetical protein|nr:MAG: hypothetical protein B6D41_11730 [Chloroflexi bacterium UTCFX4]
MSKRAPTVYAFMDESGDAGADMRRGASPHFVLTLVETTQPEVLSEEMAKLRKALNLSPIFEFRFHDTRSTERRAAFFVLLRSLDVRIRAVMVDKTKLPDDTRKWGEQKMYEYALGEIIKHSLPSELTQVYLVIDGNQSKEKFVLRLRVWATQLARALKRERIFKAIVLRESRREDGLQIADMAAGVMAEIAEHGESAYESDVMAKVRLLLALPK